jgi:hypothetical protein
MWGDPKLVPERLGPAVKDLVFDRGTMPGDQGLRLTLR